MKILIAVVAWFYQTLLMSSTVTAQDSGCRGDCISILDCPSLNSLLQKVKAGGGSDNDFSMLRNSVCAIDGSNIRVCCPQGTRNTPRPTSRPFTPRPTSRPNRQCGTNFQEFNGENAELAQWPWMVIFRASTIRSSGGSCRDTNHSCSGWAGRVTGRSSWICGGVLVTERFVLSAAHCFTNNVKIEFARIGEYDLRYSPDKGRGLTAPLPQDFNVERVILHKDYGSPCSRCNDIALVKLAKPAQLIDFFVQPICLPSNPVRDMGFSVSEFQGKIGWATGWGSTDASNILRVADILQQVNLTIQERQYCHQQKKNYPDGRMILCAGQGDGQGVCGADSGGPLMLSDRFSQKWYVVGITSFHATVCGDHNTQDVFTSIHYYVDWIRQNIQ